MTGRVTLVSGFLSNIFSIRSFMPGEIAGLKKQTKQCLLFLFFIFFSVRLLLVLRGHSFFSSPPQRPMTSVNMEISEMIHLLV